MKKTVCLTVAMMMLAGVALMSFQVYTKASPQNPVQLREKQKRRDAMEKQIVMLVNAMRVKKGVPELEIDRDVSRVAQVKSDDMLKEQYYKHKSPTLGLHDATLRKYNVKFSVSGENIAWSGVFCSSAEEVVEGWTNFKEDNDNMLDPDFTKVGVGFSEDLENRKYTFVMMLTD